VTQDLDLVVQLGHSAQDVVDLVLKEPYTANVRLQNPQHKQESARKSQGE